MLFQMFLEFFEVSIESGLVNFVKILVLEIARVTLSQRIFGSAGIERPRAGLVRGLGRASFEPFAAELVAEKFLHLLLSDGRR